MKDALITHMVNVPVESLFSQSYKGNTINCNISIIINMYIRLQFLRLFRDELRIVQLITLSELLVRNS